MVEWLITRLPEGGSGYQRPDWDDATEKALADRFLASPYADGLDGDHRDLLDSLVWFGTSYGPSDPLRWSPVSVELFGWRGVMVKDVMSYFGLQQGGVSGRATTLLRAGGFEADHFGDVTLGSPDFLVSTRRREIIDLGDRYAAASGKRW
jgi:hypothetical protein